MKKLLCLALFVAGLSSFIKAELIKLPVPAGEVVRSIDVDKEYEPFQHEPFATIIDKLKAEGKELFLAETMWGDESKPYYRYYDVAPDSLFVEFLKKNPRFNDFLTSKPIKRIYSYIYNPKTREIKLHKTAEPPFVIQEGAIVLKEAPILEDLLQELSPLAHDNRYDPSRQILILNDLNLENIPEDFFIRLAQILPSLQGLELSNNRLQSLPESIGNLRNLTALVLMGNRLQSLPESIGNLRNLQMLELSYNWITSLPESIGNLRNLRRLYLEVNPLIITEELRNRLRGVEIHK